MAWERGESKRARGIGFRGICSAHARERSRAGPLSWALHGGGKVAATRCATAAWHGLESSSAWARSDGGGRERRVGTSAKQEVPGLALHGDGRRCIAAARNRAGEQAGGRGKGPVCNF